MPLTPESVAQLFSMRDTVFTAAGKIQPESPRFPAAQRVLNLMQEEEEGRLGKLDVDKFWEDLETIFSAAGSTDDDLVETMKKCGFQIKIIPPQK